MNPNNGFSSYLWGSCLWYILEMISFNYPIHPTPEDKQHYYNFIHSLQFVLPCYKCRHNMQIYLPRSGLEENLENRKDFSRWMYNFRFHVSRQIKKKMGKTYATSEKFYNRLRARDGEEFGGERKQRCIVKLVSYGSAAIADPSRPKNKK